MGHATLLRRLLPPTSYTPNAPRLSVSVDMEGKELDRVLADAPHAVGALRPFTYQEWLEDYERIYGLPGPCAVGEQLLQERIALLAVALQERGGISLAWLKRYASLAGYDVEITEFQGFKAGISAAGDSLTNGGWCHAFLVSAPGDAPREFKAGRSVAGEALRTWGDPILECVINWRKPAHTVGLVAYI